MLLTSAFRSRTSALALVAAIAGFGSGLTLDESTRLTPKKSRGGMRPNRVYSASRAARREHHRSLVDQWRKSRDTHQSGSKLRRKAREGRLGLSTLR